MGGIFSQQLQNPPHPPSGTVSSQNLGPNITTPPRANRSYLSYFLPMSTPELTHTHTHPAGPATINIVARLLTCRGLPFEIAQRIVDDARYWTKCTRTNKKACTVIAGMPPPRQTTGSHLARWTSGQEEEVRADLDVGNSGLRDKKGEVWYLCSSPIGCDPCRQPDDGHTEESESLKRLEDSVDTSWIREIMVETYSRDQGWSDNASHYGTYEHSWSWFELSLLRDGVEVPKSRTKIQYNMHAGQYFKSHHNILDRSHDLVKMARQGDRVVLWGRAEFPGWTNNIKEATISVHSAPFPPQ